MHFIIMYAILMVLEDAQLICSQQHKQIFYDVAKCVLLDHAHNVLKMHQKQIMRLC